VTDAINASPGYRRPMDPRTHRRVPCPTSAALAPSEIKIAVYSIADRSFAEALVAAERRCVSVQVLMNSHLTAVTSPTYGLVQKALGSRGRHFSTRRSFAHRCSNGCLGSSVLHSKFYLFSHSGSRHHTVITGSSNMTGNAIRVQWNDLFTINGNQRVYAQYRQMFTRMVPDRSAEGPFAYPAVGRYQTIFYPFRRSTPKTDPTLKALRSIRCNGAAAGAGFRGHTVVYVAMHAWFADRGYALAKRLRTMARNGCHVRVLYSFMSRTTFRRLTWGAGRRLVARRVLFPGPYGEMAGKYSHLKLFAASGNVAGDRSAHVVWTGSTNWSSSSYRADDLTLRIAGTRYFRDYVREWHKIRHRRSSAVWAKYREPEGGGRAP
jgi:phosphatidylserine/phosphatidylglycerophosphate/cardiolipin synthase-like enzyme